MGIASGFLRTFGYVGSIASSAITGVVFQISVNDHVIHLIEKNDVASVLMYAARVSYPQGGGLTEQRREVRECLRLEAAERFPYSRETALIAKERRVHVRSVARKAWRCDNWTLPRCSERQQAEASAQIYGHTAVSWYWSAVGEVSVDVDDELDRAAGPVGEGDLAAGAGGGDGEVGDVLVGALPVEVGGGGEGAACGVGGEVAGGAAFSDGVVDGEGGDVAGRSRGVAIPRAHGIGGEAARGE